MKDIYQEHRGIIFFLAGVAILRWIYIYFIPILPQEAYYWYYSLKPDFSYYDHPPMVAYSIWLGTRFFGDTIFGIKFMAVVWSILTNIILYSTAYLIIENRVTNERIHWSLMTVILYNLTLFAHIYAVIIVPDTPLMFFWAYVILVTFKFQKTLKPKFLYHAGVALGFGMLSKYTAIAILPAVFIIMISNPKTRRVFQTPHPYAALLLATLIFIPVVIWNTEHNWASFGFQFSERAETLKSIQSKYIFQLIASQLFILTPMPLLLFFRTTGLILKNWRKLEDARNLLLTGLFIIIGFTFISLKSLVKMNWLMSGYLGLIVAAVLLLRDKISLQSVWVKVGSTVSIVLIITAHVIFLIENIPLGEGNTWSGWRDATQKIAVIQKELGGRQNVFIFANSYKAASLLKYYLGDDQEVYAQNIYQQPALQFEIWGIPDSLRGKNAIYVFSDRYEYKSNLDLAAKFFDSMVPAGEFEFTFMGKKKVRIISCYYAKNYHPDGVVPAQ